MVADDASDDVNVLEHDPAHMHRAIVKTTERNAATIAPD